MKKTAFEGWKNCVEMQSGDFKIIVTTDVGPRIIGGFLKKSGNLFCVKPETAGKTGGDTWNIYGGHRLWHSPEHKVRSYAPDNSKVNVKENKDGSITFCSGTEETTGVHKSMTIKSLKGGAFEVAHKLRNDNLWDIEIAAWALSVMAPGGVAVAPFPQGPTDLLPNRYLTVWPYTNMADKRLTFGGDCVLVRQDPKAKTPCKIGFNCEGGWLAYVNKGVALVKKFEHFVNAEYPDNGCSVEIYTCDFMLEIETLSPLFQLGPGEEIIHVETIKAAGGLGDIKTEKDALKAIPKLTA
jgi:hypothetical protein